MADKKAPKILVVDDEPNVGMIFHRVLGDEGYEVVSASGGQECLRALKKHTPDLVFMDIGLPGISGYDVAHRMRQMPEVKDAVLIAQSGWGQDEDKRRATQAGFDAHMVKPVDVNELRTLLTKLT